MKRILIIEDDPIISRIYAGKYQSAGYETDTAADGQEGLDRLRVFKPDFVHLDLAIPKVNGVEIIKHIRTHLETLALPVVVLSNTYQNRLVKAALDAGASECVSKATCTPKMMLEIVAKYDARLAPAARRTEPAGQHPPPETPPGSGAVSEAGPQRGEAARAHPEPPLEAPYTTEIQKHATFHAEIARGFLTRAPQKLGAIRERIAPLFRADDSTRLTDLTELCRVTESFGGQAAIAGFEEVSHLAYALAALLRELVDSPKALSSSALYTIVSASDFLSRLFEAAPDSRERLRPPPVVLVLDDDPVARRAVSLAVARLNIPAVSVDDPRAALRLLQENYFSLVFVDTEMSGLDGFEFCKELRALPGHETTPVVYVCDVADDAARRQAMESGGSELIARPFLPMELAVKALILLQ